MASVYKRKSDQGKKGTPWLFKFKNAQGLWESRVGCTDKTKTQQLADKLEADSNLEREGVIDPRESRHRVQRRRSLSEHLGEYHAVLIARGAPRKKNQVKHADSTRTYINWIFSETGATRIDDLIPSSVLQAIAKLRANGRSARTCNAYITAIKSFTRWLWKEGRTPVDELAHLEKLNETSDRRRVRRALDPAGLVRLFDAAEFGEVLMGMAGRDRAMLYRLAAETGFRASELASLVPESFVLDSNPPLVVVEAASTKNSKTANQPIRPELANLLRPWIADKPPGRPVFKIPEKTAQMLRADLESAGIDYQDASGRVLDFHALRHTFITMVVNSAHP